MSGTKKPTVVDLVEHKDGRLEPQIVSFEHATARPESLSGFQVAVYEHKMDEGKPKPRRLVAAKTSHLTYLGFNHGQCTLLADDCHIILAVRNRRSNHMRLFESSLIQLSPAMQREDQNRSLEDTPEGKPYRDQFRDLTKNFGTAAKRRRLEARERVEVNDDPLANETLERIGRVAQEGVDMTDLKGPEVLDEGIAALLPSCDRNASNPYDVYNMDSIVTSDVHDIMASYEDGVLDATDEEIQSWKDNDRYSSLFFACLESIKRVVDDDRRRKNARALIFMECLVKISLLRNTQRAKTTIPQEFPKLLKDAVIKRFTPGKAQTNSTTFKDKAACHIIIIALLLSDLKIDLQAVTSSLHLRVHKAAQLCKLVGATTSIDVLKEQHTATLKLPLAVLPRTRVSPKRGGRGRGRK